MRPSLILTPALVLLGLLSSTSTALSQTTFTENFDKEPTKGWFYSCQKEFLAEGTSGFLRVSGGGHALWLGDGTNEAKAADFTLTVKHRYEQGKGTGEVAFRVSGTLEEHQFNWVMFQPKAVVLGRRFHKAEGVSQQDIKTAMCDFKPGVWHDIMIRATGANIAISVDGATVLTATDPQPLSAGMVAFGVIKDSGAVDYRAATLTLGAAAPTKRPR